MRYRENLMQRQGSLLASFFPYLLGLLFARYVLSCQRQYTDLFLPAALVLLVFAGASAYGFVTNAAAFVLLGIYASGAFSRISIASISDGSSLTALLTLLPWFPAVAAAAYLGQKNVYDLLNSRLTDATTIIKNCLYTSAIQCGLITGAILISRMIKT